MFQGTISEVSELMAANLEKTKMQKQRRLDTCRSTAIGVFVGLCHCDFLLGPSVMLCLSCLSLHAQERLLGVPEGSVEDFCLALDEELKAKNLSWTGKGEQAPWGSLGL